MKDANADPDFNVMAWLVKFHPSVAVKVLNQCGPNTVRSTYKFFLLMPKRSGEDRLLMYLILIVSGRNPIL
jgi:hypothetical protein